MGFFAGNDGNSKILAIGPDQNPHTTPNTAYFHSSWPYLTCTTIETTAFGASIVNLSDNGVLFEGASWSGRHWSDPYNGVYQISLYDTEVRRRIVADTPYILQANIGGIWYTIPPVIEAAYTTWTGSTGSGTARWWIHGSNPRADNTSLSLVGGGSNSDWYFRVMIGGALYGMGISALRYTFFDTLTVSGGNLVHHVTNPNNDQELLIDKNNLRIGGTNYLNKRFFVYTDSPLPGTRVGGLCNYGYNFTSECRFTPYFRANWDVPEFTTTRGGADGGYKFGKSVGGGVEIGGGYWSGDDGIIRAVAETYSDRPASWNFEQIVTSPSRSPVNRRQHGWGCPVFKVLGLIDCGSSLSIDSTRIMANGTEVFGPNVKLFKTPVQSHAVAIGGENLTYSLGLGDPDNWHEFGTIDARGAVSNGWITGLITGNQYGLQSNPSPVNSVQRGTSGYFSGNNVIPFRIASGQEIVLANSTQSYSPANGPCNIRTGMTILMRNDGGILRFYRILVSGYVDGRPAVYGYSPISVPGFCARMYLLV